MRKAGTHEKILLAMKPEPVRTNPWTSGRSALLPGSFDDLFREHWPQVYRLLLRLVGDPAEAEDLALQTFVILFQQPPAGAEAFNFGGWLHRVAANLGLHSLRSYKRRERYELTAGKVVLEDSGDDRPVESIVARADEQRAARLVLAGMPDRQARLLILRYSGAAYKEIATALGIPPGSVGTLLLRAEREFEKRHRSLLREEEK